MAFTKHGQIDKAMNDAADLIGCEKAAIQAVFAVEASGSFFNGDGSPIDRFEPHHIDSSHWAEIGYSPGNLAPWRASLKIKTQERRRMAELAIRVCGHENTYLATSFGAGQIMGFNHLDAGYESARHMRKAFYSDYEQIIGFARLVIEWNLGPAIRSQDWFSFATKWNGTGKAHHYAGQIEAEYAHYSGGKRSPVTLRIGSKGQAVQQLQMALVEVNMLPDNENSIDGYFGRKTEEALKAFQKIQGIEVDGIAGAVTWKYLKNPAAGPAAHATDPVPTATSGERVTVKSVVETLKSAGSLGLGSALIAFWDKIPESGQIILMVAIGVTVVVGVGVGSYVLMSKRMASARTGL